jgi:predicted nucleic acid-binding protein
VNFLLDTTAISEWVRPRPDPGVVRWFDQVDEDRTHLSVITLGEARKGVELLHHGQRRDRLERWVRDELPDRFRGRVLPVDPAVADRWGKLLARAQVVGTSINNIDGLIAATALTHRMAVVTRNVAHFRAAGVEVLNPWQGAGH